MTPVLYNLALALLAPGVALAFALRQVRRGRRREGWAERLGRLPEALVARCQGREVIWVHAVSVGETIAAKPLLAELRQRRPGAVLLLSQVTETGRATAATADADGLFYLPLDLPQVVIRVLDQLKPRLFVTVDTELWPNLFWLCHRRGVRTAMSNGRISDRSLARIERFRLFWLYRWVLSNVDALLMQSANDAVRVRRLGAPAGRVQITGNLKVDEAYPEVDAARLAWWHETLGLAPDSPVLLGGSTAPNEEELLLAAWQALRQEQPGLRLVLVPRAVDRAAEIGELVAAAGAVAVRRSELPARAAESLATGAVVVVDTIGELSELYALASVAFVGRSLVSLGGSNVLQAAAQGKPVLSGPHFHNVRESVQMLVDGGAGRVVADGAELTAAVAELLAEPGRREAMGAAGRELVAGSRGATARTAAALVELLDA